MKIAYLDCSSGISGDMCLGALVDAGAPLRKIEDGLKGLPVTEYRLEAKKVKRAGIAATKVDVVIRQRAGRQPVRTWKDINNIINISSLPSHLKQKGLEIFRRLFTAEGKVHGKAYNKTHLHELGAVDCLVDIFGSLIGLDLLEIDKVYSSTINLGSGFVMIDHGRLPVPAPATAELLKDTPVYSSHVPHELTTPTGAILIRELTTCSPAMPLMKIDRIGYGAGQKDIPGLPNVLRIFVGRDIPSDDKKRLPKITVIETNIDDMNPQVYDYVMELLFKAGALDVYLVPVIMKKGRPGIVLTILCAEHNIPGIMDIVFRETTTIGLRFYEVSRTILDREIIEAETPLGRLKVKVSKKSDGTVKVFPEYDDCVRIAKKYNMPLIEVMQILAKKPLRQFQKIRKDAEK